MDAYVTEMERRISEKKEEIREMRRMVRLELRTGGHYEDIDSLEHEVGVLVEELRELRYELTDYRDGLA